MEQSRATHIGGFLLTAYGAVTNSLSIRLLDWLARMEGIGAAAYFLRRGVVAIAPGNAFALLLLCVGGLLLFGFNPTHLVWKRPAGQGPREAGTKSSDHPPPAAAVAPESPSEIPAPDAGNHLTKLIAKREVLSSDIRRLDLSLEHCRQAVERYRQSLTRYSQEKVIRPSLDAEWPDAVLRLAIAAFTNDRFKPRDWAAGFNHPRAAMDEWQDPGFATRNVREMFVPEHNRRYIGLHRENLAQLDEALDEVEKRAQELKIQQGSVEMEIQAEARRING